MARRSLLTGDERRRLFELPVDDREVAVITPYRPTI